MVCFGAPSVGRKWLFRRLVTTTRGFRSRSRLHSRADDVDSFHRLLLLEMTAKQRSGIARKPTDDKKSALPAQSKPGQPDKSSTVKKLTISLVLMVTISTVWLVTRSLIQRQGSGSLHNFASAKETVDQRHQHVPCSKDYIKEKDLYPECVPRTCGRAVMDSVVSKEDAEHLLRTAKAGLSLGGSSGGASILDLHSGALSKGDRFIDIYTLMRDKTDGPVFSREDFEVYRKVKNQIHDTIAATFQVPSDKLFLTSPTFFSRMTSKPAKTMHDEYWHVHTDKETYGSFHYTSLVYLTDYESDFTGGRFIFVDEGRNTTVEPKKGRLSFFTSGWENPHHVEKIESGTRYAITVSFTCDPKKAIADPTLGEHS